MFENPRRGRQARSFTTNAPKILVLKSSSEQKFSRKLPLGAPEVMISEMKSLSSVVVSLLPRSKLEIRVWQLSRNLVWIATLKLSRDRWGTAPGVG